MFFNTLIVQFCQTTFLERNVIFVSEIKSHLQE